MKNKLLVWQIWGFIFTSVAGVLLHFLFDLTNQNAFVAVFSAVNESIYEHTKLLFFPMLVYALTEARYFSGKYQSFLCVKLIGIIGGIVAIPVIYYTIKGIFSAPPDFVNIALFFAVTAVVYVFEYYLLKSNRSFCKSQTKAVFILILVGILMATFTFYTPKLPFFEDPVNNTYGYYEENSRN